MSVCLVSLGVIVRTILSCLLDIRRLVILVIELAEYIRSRDNHRYTQKLLLSSMLMQSFYLFKRDHPEGYMILLGEYTCELTLQKAINDFWVSFHIVIIQHRT